MGGGLTITLGMLAGIGAGVVGLVLLLWGLIGSRQGREPRCRACSFDLTGLGETPGVCPECGVALAGPKAVSRGHRKRRPAAIVVGLLMLLGVGGVAGVQAAGFSWYRVMPTSVLFDLAQGRGSRSATESVTVLAERLGNGELDPGWRDRIVDLALDLQADAAPSGTWSPAWLALLAAAYDNTLMTPEEVLRYIEHGVEVSLVHRDRVIAGTNTSVTVQIAGGRIHDTIVIGYAAGPGVIEFVRPGGDAAPVAQLTTAFWGGGFVSGKGTSGTRVSLAVDPAAAPGPAIVRLKGRQVRVDESLGVALPRGAAIDALDPADPPEGVLILDLVLEEPIEVLPAGTPIDEVVSWIDDPGAEAAVAASVGLAHVAVSDESMYISFSNTTLPLAFAVYARPVGDPTAERYLDSVAAPAGTGQHNFGVSLPKGMNEVDIILRPDQAAAYEDSGLTSIWRGEVLIENVRLDSVTWQTPAKATKAVAIPPP